MVHCLNCKSTKVKVFDANFAELKPEGQPAVKHSGSKFLYHCWNCNNDWESIPEAEQDYFEYDALKSRTTFVVNEVKPGKSIGPAAYIKPDELLRRHELAKKLVDSYKHVLDLKPGEWFDIEQDAL